MKRVAWLLLPLLLACGAPVEKHAEAAQTPAVKPSVTAAPATETARPSGPRFRAVARTAKARGRGQLKFSYGPAKTKARREMVRVFREERLFEDVIEELNGSLVLPHDVNVRMKECGEVNAFYDPNNKSVTLCYELFDQFMEMFTDEEAEEDESGAKSAGALVFVFYHELGHALIDVYDLPVTGREEDAVDQLATVLLLETWEGEDSELAILSSAEWFDLGDEEGTDESELADEHSLDEQRYYNLVCWIYGSDPEYFSDIADEWGLPPARAERCSDEYARMSGAWNTLLGPHMRATE